MEIKINKKDFEFLKSVADRELPLKQIVEELGITKQEVQRIFNNLQGSGMIKSRKEGRERLVKITNNGEYFRDFYKKQERKNGKEK